MAGSEDITSAKIQDRALMDRIQVLSVGGKSPQTRAVFKELFVCMETRLMVGDTLKTVVSLMEGWERDEDDEMVGKMFGMSWI